MDLERVELIKQSTLDNLRNIVYLENLILGLGFNNEILREQPQIVKENTGGLLI